MNHAANGKIIESTGVTGRKAPAIRGVAGWMLVLILAIGTLLRVHQLGALSFWYDEVVTMRLAQAPTIRSLLERLESIDATRAPLHPLMLQQWIRLFGESEAAARGLSVLAGVVTIALVFWIGRCAYDTQTGLWAAGLAALSPALIVYSREARMYAWLVLSTCIAWHLLLSFRRSRTAHLAFAYGLSVVALIYMHPLGILMAVTLALAGLVIVCEDRARLRLWLFAEIGAAVLVLPWVGKYLDHRPEFLSGRLPIKFLAATPIGFIGGDSRVMLGAFILMVYGLARCVATREPEGRVRIDRDHCVLTGLLIFWLVLPPTLLYVYSRFADPIFGPARYTVFVAPAYLILLGAGLRYTPAMARVPLSLALAIVAVMSIGPKAYAPDLKADWREFARSIARSIDNRPGRRLLVIVASTASSRNVEVETARHYLPSSCAVIASDEATDERLAGVDADAIYYAIGSRDQALLTSVPEGIGSYRLVEGMRYPGLIIYRTAF